MAKVISLALVVVLTLLLSGTAWGEPAAVDVVGLLAQAERGMTAGEVKELMGTPDAETEIQMMYDDPMNKTTIQYNFTEGALSSINIVIAYTYETVDLLYVHFLLYEAQLMEHLGQAPSFQSYVDYMDREIAKTRFDGGMYGWYGVNDGDIYVGATFDSGTPLLYISSSGLAGE